MLNLKRTALISLCICTLSFAKTFNVSDETQLKNALSTAASNGEDDVIILSEGTFSLKNNNYSSFKYLSQDGKSLTIEGKGVDKTVIDGSGVSGQSLLYISSSIGGNFHIKNLTFKGGNTTFTDIDGSQNFTGGGLYLVFYGDITIENVKFEKNTAGIGYGGGAYVSSLKGNITIKNSFFYKNISKTGSGLYISIGNWGYNSTGNLNLYNNIFYENGGFQGVGFYIQVYTTGDVNILNNTVIKNVIFPNADPQTAFGAGGYIFMNSSANNINVYNNIFWLNENNSSSTYKIKDLFFDNYSVNPNNFNLFNNNIDPNNTDSFALRSTLTINLGNNIYSNPNLKDITNLNFMPDKSSPVIDKGENSVVSFKTDFAGNQRIYNNTVDIGALEYSPSSSSGTNTSNNSSLSTSNSSSGGGGCSFGKANSLILILIFSFVILSRKLRGKKDE